MGKKIRLLLDRTTGKAVMVGDKAIAVHSTDELRISTTATLSQSEYDALATKVVDTLYLISGTSGFIKAYLGSIPLFRMSGTKSVTGRSPIVFSSIDGGTIVSLVRYGKCEQGSVPCVTAITQLGKCVQNGTPTPSAPVDIVCNNGAIKARHQSGLPLGYQLLAYARSSGTQYIDLGYKGNGNTKVEIKFKYHTASSATGSGRVFGSRTTAQSDAFATGTSAGTVAATATNQLFWCYDSQTFFIDNKKFGLNVWKTVVFSAKEHSIDGVSVGNDYNIVEFETPQNLKLFGFDQSSGTMGVGYVDVAYCKLWDNGVLVRNIVFAKNASNVVGGYDLVSGQFLTNAGTGDFVAGDPIADPMEIYTDGTPEVLTVRGKNLLDTATTTAGFINAYGDKQVSTTLEYSALIPVVSGQTYTWSGNNNSSTETMKRLHGYDSNGNWVEQLQATGVQIAPYSVTATIPNGVAYVRLSGIRTDSPDTNVQFELGSTVTAYEPYTAQTVNDIPTLLGVGGYKDVVELVGGIKTGKVRAHVFDGTEADWTFDSTYDRAIIRPLPNFKSNTTRDIEMLCTHFVSKHNGEAIGNLTVGDFYNATQNGLVFHISQTNLDDWKAYLAAQYAAGTPVIVIYPRSTEVTETITAHPELTNGKYATASAEGNVDDITVTVTRGVTSTPTPYNPIPVICNNGEVTGQGATGTPEVLTLSAAGETDQTATVVDLLQVGDYKDEQEIISGVKTGKVGIKVYTGGETFNTSIVSQCYTDTASFGLSSSLTNRRLVCTHFDSADSLPAQGSRQGVCVIGKNGASCHIVFGATVAYPSIDDFKAFLAAQYAAGTPVIVIYPLVTETTEQVTPQPLDCHSGTNIVESNVSDAVIRIDYPE